MAKLFRIYSWNVNGLRAAARKGIFDWMKTARGDVIGMQETRAMLEQLSPEVASPPRWRSHFVSAERKGYSGVGMYSRRKPDEVRALTLEERFDTEGRLQLIRFGNLSILNGYFPNGSGKNRDHSRVPYKIDFYEAVLLEANRRRDAGQHVVVMGDFNTALEPIDLARPKSNHNKTSGFLDVERDALRRWVDAGWIDTFREFESGGGHYTWWSNRPGIRERNVGWRIDYMLISASLRPLLQTAKIHPEVLGSDHCPISIDLDPEVLG